MGPPCHRWATTLSFESRILSQRSTHVDAPSSVSMFRLALFVTSSCTLPRAHSASPRTRAPLLRVLQRVLHPRRHPITSVRILVRLCHCLRLHRLGLAPLLCVDEPHEVDRVDNTYRYADMNIQDRRCRRAWPPAPHEVHHAIVDGCVWILSTSTKSAWPLPGRGPCPHVCHSA